MAKHYDSVVQGNGFWYWFFQIRNPNRLIQGTNVLLTGFSDGHFSLLTLEIRSNVEKVEREKHHSSQKPFQSEIGEKQQLIFGDSRSIAHSAHKNL